LNEEGTRVRLSQEGSDEAFTELIDAYQTHVYNLCYRMLGDAQAAEDAAQETFLRAYENLHRYDDRRPFGTWLLSIAAHYCIDRLRRRKFSFTSTDEDPGQDSLDLPDPDAPSPEIETIHREQREQMQLMLNRLNAVDRAAIVLRYWQDASEAEIAETLGLTVSAVKSRLHRARRELADHWQEAQPRTSAARSPHESLAL
jgi:RNA polymerase sigma-70 factor (ECF subfamily)